MYSVYYYVWELFEHVMCDIISTWTFDNKTHVIKHIKHANYTDQNVIDSEH